MITYIKYRRLRRQAKLALKECNWIQKKQRGRGDEKLLSLLAKATDRLKQALSQKNKGEIFKALGKIHSLLGNELKPYRKSKFRETLESILWALFVVFLLRTFIVQPFKIPTGSMEPTLLGVQRECPVCHWKGGYYDEICPTDKVSLKTVRIGDRILVNKFLYGARTPDRIPFTDILLPYLELPALRSPRRGDIIVFHYPKDESQDYVKRLAGLPGETLEIKNGKLIVDGKQIEDPPFSLIHYTNTDLPFHEGPLGRSGVKTTIPFSGMELALSYPLPEHLKRLIESEGHSVEEKDDKIWIDGKAEISYPVENNYYFALGDNSKNSKDSRFWGFVPERNLIGNVFMVYWPPKQIGFPR